MFAQPPTAQPTSSTTCGELQLVQTLSQPHGLSRYEGCGKREEDDGRTRDEGQHYADRKGNHGEDHMDHPLPRRRSALARPEILETVAGT